MAKDNTGRFSNRVEDYVKYRPGYPEEIITYLQDEYQLTTDGQIADIGAGTGISTEMFLNAGYAVVAVEPNKEMREKCIALLGHLPGFTATDGTAEHTKLEQHSVDAVIAGQAFHWFDVALAKTEFRRILKDKGLVAVLFNERLALSDFEKEYDALIVKHASDYVQVDHRNISDEHLAAFFSPEPVALKIFPNKQVFDFEGLKGRLLSSSYMPAADAPGFEAMISDLKQLFKRHEKNGLIQINYNTKVHTGRL